MVDKNLFLYDLAVVASLKNEGHYLKEWLDYHLMAGVEHFYLYDNDSTDNQAEVAAPYVEAGFVDYIPAPGKLMQMSVYNDAAKQFKFQCRYMAFIDGDEFIYPKSERSIVEVVDEILSHDPNAAGLSINWHCFGSNGQEKADYSRGVLERFTQRAPNDWYFTIRSQPVGGNPHVKTICNPRTISYLATAHNAIFFEGKHSVNENGDVVTWHYSNPVTAEKIVINHYYTKSFDEYVTIKRSRGSVANLSKNFYRDSSFKIYDRNEEFDDGILRYRDVRAKIYQPPDNSHADERLLNALAKNLSPMILPTTPPQFYAGKMETFLTCRAVSTYLRKKFPDIERLSILEESSIIAIVKSLSGMNLADARLLIRELPNLLRLPYPAVKNLRGIMLQIIPQLKSAMRLNSMWKDYVELDCIQDFLKSGE